MKQLETWYLAQTSVNQLEYDPQQFTVLQQLDNFLNAFNNQSWLKKLFQKQNGYSYYGCYIYGSVGRGKSMIINELFQYINVTQKIRLHFHEFMQNIHQQLASLKNKADSLQYIAKQLRKQYQIIFLDEMHISDIATAMILNNLLHSLFKQGIYIVTSSNYMPNDLYKNGLMRERFLPAITLINQKLQVISLEGHNDYRLLNHSDNQLFLIKTHNSYNKMNETFNNLSNNLNIEENGVLTIQNRQFQFIKKSSTAIWLNFTYVCGTNRSQLDYLELVTYFQWFIIDGVHKLDHLNKDIARRFTWLIDILYDNHCNLAIISSVELENIYSSGDFANEFTRTVSRLIEMQTLEYLNNTKNIKHTPTKLLNKL